MTLSDVIFAPEWWMVVAAVLVGIGAFVVGNRRLDKKLMRGGVGVVLLAGVWWGIGAWVETDREAVEGGTKRFVAGVVDRKPEELTKLMAPAATLGAFNREDIAAAAGVYAEEFGLKGALITGSEFEERGTQVNFTIRVISRHEGGARGVPDTLPTDWQFTWGKLPASEGGGWRIVQITPVRVGNQEVSGIVGRFFTRRPGR